MDGFIIINKPQGMTSHDVCEKIKKLLHMKKVGHTGTLDPLATGVLVVALGKATKLIQYLESQSKTYQAEALLGIDTDTYDILGQVIHKNPTFEITETEVKKALFDLQQQKTQIPPIYSAIKVNGKKLYDYALENKKVEIKARPIKIDVLDLLSIEFKNHQTYLNLVVKANKGFYVRSLIHDLGVKLNTYATMSNLKRIQAGIFDISMCSELEELTEKNIRLYSIEEIFSSYPQIEVSDYIAKLCQNGIQFDERQFSGDSLFRVYNQKKLIAIYAPCGDKKYKPVIYIGGKE